MKPRFLVVILILSFWTLGKASDGPINTTPADSQRLAVAKYPALAVESSALHSKFVALYGEKKKTDPSFFANPNWPQRLADEAASSLLNAPSSVSTSPPSGQSVDGAEKSDFSATTDVRLSNGKVLKNVTFNSCDESGAVLTPSGFAATAIKYPWSWFTAADQAQMRAIDESRREAVAAKERVKKSAIVLMVEPFSFGKTETKVWIQQCQKGEPIRDNSNQFQDTYIPVGNREIAILDEVWPISAGKEKQVLKLYPLGVSDDSSRNPVFTRSAERALAAASAK